MALTSAMLVGFTGITSNSTAVDTVGNNLANLNTTAFKSQRTLFETLLYRTVSEGEAPSDTTGGTLPRQIGFGATVSSIQRNFGQGGFDSTGFPSDLAVDGEGLFILDGGERGQIYTRDGSFRLDAGQTLVAASGAPVQVFAADGAGNIDTGTLQNLVIPLGTARLAIPTTEVILDGRLDNATTVAAAGAIVSSQPLATAGGVTATATTPLTELVNENGVPLFASGDIVTVQGVKGGVTMPESTFLVGTTGTSLGDLANFMQGVLGLDTDPTTSGDAGISVVNGSIVVRSNPGEINAVTLDAGSITNTTGVIASPFAFTEVQEAIGGGVTTTFQVFDSVGNPVNVRVRASLEDKSSAGTTWRFYAESVDDTDLSPLLGTGTITFDATGQFIAATGIDLSIDRAATGSVSPLTFTIDFSPLTGLAGATGASELVMASQNGAPAGVMTGFGIAADGIVTAVYSNQYEEVLGQVALATFANNEGLVALSENAYTIGPNSGDAKITAPRTGVAGAIRAGALEQSNVEIAREFINLISAATGISAASRVVRTADELLQELMLLAR